MTMYTGEGCSKCLLLKRLLDINHMDYTLVADRDKVILMADKIGSRELPILEIEGKHYSGTEAIKQIQRRM